MSNAAWIECDMCEDYLCQIHGEHVADCECPPIEDWDGMDPYSEGLSEGLEPK